MKIAILDAKTLGGDISFSSLEKLGELYVYPKTSKEEIPQRLKGVDCAVFNKAKLTAEVLEKCPDLKLVCVTATGYDNVDVDYCRKRGIAVCNVKGYSTQSVALVTVSSALSLITHLSQYDRHVKSGEYTKGGVQNRLVPVYHELCGKTWGIVGLGDIGKAVAKVAESFGCKVLAFKRTHTKEYECVELAALMEKSDIISVHLPANSETVGIISREMIAKMKKDAILVNAARGAVIDEEAITDAILENAIAGFATDVYSTEPVPQGHVYEKLYGCDNVILTPHMAWGAYEARVRLIDEICMNIESYNTGKARNRVDM